MTDARTIAVTAADGHCFEVHLHRAADSRAPTLVFLSALGTPARVYKRFACAMATQGISVCTADWRGIASSSLRAARRCDFGYRHLLETDIPALLATVRAQFPEATLWLGGHSLGGQMSLLTSAREAHGIGGLALVASGSVHMPAYPLRARLGIGLLVGLSHLVTPLLGYFPGSRLGFGGREAAGIMRDWCKVAISGEYRPSGTPCDYERAMQTLDLPVLAINFAADAWSPMRATQLLLDKAPACRITHQLWQAADTGGVALDHFSWTRQPTLIARALSTYIHTASAAPTR